MCTIYMGTCWYETMSNRHQVLQVSGRRIGILFPDVHDFLNTTLRKLQEHCEASKKFEKRAKYILYNSEGQAQ